MRDNNHINESYQRIVCFPTNRILCMCRINESHINESYVFVSQRSVYLLARGKCCSQKGILYMIRTTNHVDDSNAIRAKHHTHVIRIIHMIWIVHMIAFWPVLRVYDWPCVVLIITTRIFSEIHVLFRQRATDGAYMSIWNNNCNNNFWETPDWLHSWLCRPVS